MLYWLEAHGRRVINGLAAFELEVSKPAKHLVLNRRGIRTPRTVLALGKPAILKAAATFDGPFITKHNQGGKGLGIRLFDSADQLEAWLDDPSFDAGPGGKVILQQYIKSPEPFITRVEVVGKQFVLAMRLSTSDGFEPAHPMRASWRQSNPDVCPAEGPASKFSTSPLTADDPLVAEYIALCEGEGLDLAGIEFVEDADGNRYTYDINGTTNYSGVFAEQVGIEGMWEVAKYIRGLVASDLDVIELQALGLK